MLSAWTSAFDGSLVACQVGCCMWRATKARSLRSISSPMTLSRRRTLPRSSRRSCMHATSLTLRLSGFHDGTSRCALDLADLPPQGWDFEYLQLEPDRRGLPIFRPVVPVRIAASNLSPIFALVDSGCEHCLAASWLAHELGIDLRDATDTLELGIGGRTVTARFVEVEIQLHQDETSNEFVTWRAEVGFIEPWRGTRSSTSFSAKRVSLTPSQSR